MIQIKRLSLIISIALGFTLFGNVFAADLGDNITINAGDSNAKEQLANALCSSYSGSNVCSDNSARTITINGIIDFNQNVAFQKVKGCVYSDNNCVDTKGAEQIIDRLGYCDNKKIIDVTINPLGQDPLVVGSNKVIRGAGANSGVKGRGFLLTGGVSNIIIENLSITDINEQVIWGGDAITIDNASNVKIDHNYIARIGRQFVVTGWGPATDISITNNNFDGTTGYGHYCDNRHYWNFLFYGAAQSISFQKNWVHNTSGRLPEVGQQDSVTGAGIVHVANNLFQSNFYMGARTAPNVAIFLEGNDYDNVGTNIKTFNPIMKKNSNDPIFAPSIQNLNAANPICNSYLGRNCFPNIFEDGQTYNTFTVDKSIFNYKFNVNVKNFVGGSAEYRLMDTKDVKNYVLNNAGPK